MIRILSVDFHEQTERNIRKYARYEGLLNLLRTELAEPLDDVTWPLFLGLWAEARE